jgi:hypothetical protein
LDAPFHVSPAAARLPALETLDIRVGCSPTAEGAFEGLLTLKCLDIPEPLHSMDNQKGRR